MLGHIKLLLAGGAIAALPVVPMVAGPPQDPIVVERAAKPLFREETRWNFAALQYRTLGGELKEIPARSISKLWLLARPDGGMLLEILYENSDYTLVSLDEMHVIRRSATNSAVDLPIVRGWLEDMAFPTFRK